jgi:NAD(P)-dependent dehydrogenase (short-subunit alcohol dehydrogenase family)
MASGLTGEPAANAFRGGPQMDRTTRIVLNRIEYATMKDYPSMQRTIVITGSTSGMGLVSRNLLERSGARIIGVSNTSGAEITADLSTDQGVDSAVAEIIRLCDGRLDGVFANAGVDGENSDLVFGLNYFGVIRLLEKLRPLLAESADARVLINASNSVVITPGIPEGPVEALLRFDRAAAKQLIAATPHWTYQTSKTAITRWARKAAAGNDWAGSGISMNIIAPGPVMTPLLEHDMQDPRKAAGINGLPKPLGEFVKPENVASLVKFLLMDDSRFIVGQYLIIDGGNEAIWRHADYPSTWNITAEEFMKKIS